MENNSTNTMVNQKVIRSTLEQIFLEHGYPILTTQKLKSIEEIPLKYVIKNAQYKTIYNRMGRSEFLIINTEKDINLRIEIKIQISSGSVDEKFPYLYLNSVLSHKEDVLIILDGDGYKLGAKKWLEQSVKDKWLMNDDKSVQIKNIVQSISYLQKIL